MDFVGLRVAFAILAVGCGGGAGNDDCGPNSCGRCAPGCVQVDRCIEGRWHCECRCDDGGGTDAPGTDAPTTDATPDGPTSSDGPAPDVSDPCALCTNAVVEFGPEGGKTAVDDDFELRPCRTFAAQRTNRSGGASVGCDSEIPCLGDAITIGDVLGALAHPDVRAAFVAAPVLYGRDPRPADGSVYRIAIGEDEVLVGDDCRASDPSCRPVPHGVRQAVDRLQALTRQQLGLGRCALDWPERSN
ncbi:MAG: hypothetical protein RMK74_04475 [Myxococcales bacterium]|nr:hypothetical protein [Myxococcales bacterium]